MPRHPSYALIHLTLKHKVTGGLIYAKNQLHITAANQLLNDKSSIVAQGSILINDTNNNLNTN